MRARRLTRSTVITAFTTLTLAAGTAVMPAAAAVAAPTQDLAGAAEFVATSLPSIAAVNASTPNYDTGGPYPSGYHLEAAVSVKEYRQFEAFYIIGKGRLNGNAQQLTIFLETAPKSGGSWSRIARTRSSNNGYYEFVIRPEREQRYRVVIARDWTSSALTINGDFSPKFVGTSHTLEQRRAELAWRLGKNTRTVRTMQPYQYAKYPFPARAGRWQSFENGILAEITRTNGKVSTWLIEGAALDHFLALGGWTRQIGTPARDAICVELEGSCTQLFSGGAIYTNNRGVKTHVYGPSDWRMEIVAAAMSQRNYREPSWRQNKFNSWIGANNAWCAVFLAWAASASGHADAVPQRASWSATLSDLERSRVLKKGRSGITPGTMVVFDFLNDGIDRPTHIGMVVSVSGNTVYTIEGNTTNGTSDQTRGVFYRQRPISSIWGTADPRAFANWNS